MKLLLICCITLLVVSAPLRAQWNLIHPYPQNATIEDIHFVDAQLGWFVTDIGTIWRTTDGGETWGNQRKAYEWGLTSVDFVDPQNGWTGGQYGPMLRTTNGGTDWYTIGFIPADLTRLEFVTHSNGWAATGSGAVHRSHSGGASWDSSFQWPWEFDEDVWVPPGPILGLSVVDSSTAWLVGERRFRRNPGLGNIIARTTDGGLHWDTVRINFQGRVTDICFVSATRGWYLADSATIVGTTDGGANWQMEFDGRQLSVEPLLDMHCSDPSHAWAVGRSGLVVRTTDGGNTWFNSLVNSTSSILHSVFFTDNTVGWSGGRYGMIFKTTDAGSFWQSLYRGTPVQFREADFVSPEKGWATGASSDFGYAGVYTTNDSGFTWYPQLQSSPGQFIGIAMVDSMHGWVVGQLAGGSSVFSTSDGGATWTNTGISPGFGANGVAFANARTGWIYGGPAPGTYQQVVLRTTEAGQNWTSVIVDTATFGPTVTDLAYLDSLNVFCVNQHGVFKSTDGGSSWQHIYADPGYPVKLSIFFTDVNRGWMAGVGGNILHTTDGGFTWTPQSSGVTTQLQKIRFIDGQRGWAVGLGQGVHTSNGGVTWVRNAIPVLSSMFDITFVTNENQFFAWSVGWDGTVLRLHDQLTGIPEPRQGEIPHVYSLYQNYPNPFNPSTTIRFEIPRSGHVALKVFDVLGREAATLADGEMKSGSYEKELDGSNLSAGLYFIRLVAGGRTQTIKALLLK